MEMNRGDKKVLNKSITILLILVAVFIVVVLVSGKNANKVDNYGEAVTKTPRDNSSSLKQAIVSIDNNLLVARVADSEASREKGLSGTHFLNEKSGMWFVFEEADQHGFWMKDTKIPLDIIWVDSFGTIVHMEENVRPESYPKVYTPPVPAQYVLEVMAGYADRNDIEIGDSIFVTPLES